MNSIFEIPEKKQPETELIEHETPESSTKTQNEPSPQRFEDGTAHLFESWNQPTEVPEDHFASNKVDVDDEVDDEPVDDDDEFDDKPVDDDEIGLDADSLEIISESVVSANDRAATWLINFLNGPESERFPGASPKDLNTIQKAWKGILLRIKYKPSGWDALLASNFAAYGWHLFAGLLSFVARWMRGAVRWPWQAVKRAKKAMSKKPESGTIEAEGVILKGSDFTGKNSDAQEPEPDYEPYNEDPENRSEPVKVDLWTNKPFKGEGRPKSSKHKHLIGQFKDMKSFRAYCNHHGLSGPKAKKPEKENEE